MAISEAFDPLGGAVGGENDDCTFDFDELDGVELGVGLDDNEALANELEIRLFEGLEIFRASHSQTNQSSVSISTQT